jgi:hypothetical protein
MSRSVPTGVADDVGAESNNERHTNDATEKQTQRGKYSDTIQRLRDDLKQMMDTDYGLLHELISLYVITRNEADEVRHEHDNCAVQLLNLVMKMSDAQQEQFLMALDNTQQTHVSEYIRANGELKSLEKDKWPLLFCDEIQMLEKNYYKLIEAFDWRFGLLDELFSEGCINRLQMETMKVDRRNAAQNSILLDMMYRKSFADFSKLLICLERTKQALVMSLLSSSYTCSDQPLSEALKSRLIKNHAKLVELIDTKCGLLDELRASDCITRRQRDYIESEDSIARLLDILSRGSEVDFMKFIDGLRNTGQEHVVCMLLGDGVVPQLVAKTRSSADKERLIAERFMAVLRSSSNVDREITHDEVKRLVNELRNRGIDLIAVNTQHSIGLFYLCRSPDALQRLYDSFTCGEMKQIVERIFTVLLNDGKSVVVDSLHCGMKQIVERIFTVLLNDGKSVVVDSLHWDMKDYIDCTQDFYAALNLKTFSEVLELAKCARLESTAGSVCSLHVDKLLSKLLQLTLNKAMGQLFVIIHRVTPRAAVYAMATLGGVSTLWWRTITYRQHNKRVLKRYFQHVYSPFKRNPRRLQSIQLEKNVNCLTEFNGQLYVGVGRSASLQVFVSRPPFSRLDDIIVQGLNDPRDIVVCRDTSQLYIADYDCDYGSQYAIWRVNLLFNKQVDKFITIQWRPYSLSVNSKRLLITPFSGDALFLYGDDGSLLNHIKLPDYIRALHAVETTHNTYIVSHRNKYYRDPQSAHNSVSEVNVDGQVVRTFNSQHIDIDSIQFNEPHYLALYDNNHVIVADYCNKRVVVLKSDLKLKRVLMTSLGRQAMRLCLSKSTGLMFIKYYSDIDIYKVVT